MASRSAVPLICVIGLGLGLALTLAGLIWSQIARPSHVWSPEQAAEYDAANKALHAATVAHDHARHDHAAGEEGPPVDIEAARQRFERIEAELEGARKLQSDLGLRLIQFGLVAAIVFGVGYLASRGE